jgi:hypothetical protein
MSAVSVEVILSVATLVVVGAASVAAIIQLHHLRTSNQLNALLEIMNQWNLPAVQPALGELRKMPQKMNDAQYLEALKSPGPMDRAAYPEFLALDLWEQIGTYCKYGLVDEDILLDITASQVTSAWKHAEPAITIIRERTGPWTLENFEYLAVRAKRWSQQHPKGAYPSKLSRMPDV